MHLIDGTALAQQIRQQVKQEGQTLGRPARLAVLLVGNDPASELYVSLKQKAAQEAGIEIELAHESIHTSQQALVQRVSDWSHDDSIDGILVQLPLPPQFDEQAIIAAIAPEKDVDGFHPNSIESLKTGNALFIPPVIEGCLRLIAQTPLIINGAKTVLIVNSDIFALPFQHLLKRVGAFVTTMSPDEINKQALADADLVIIAIGRAKFLTSAMVKRDAVLIDIGTNRLPDGKIIGDCDKGSFDFSDVWLTPVPGGVGPMTIAQLLANVVRSAKQRQTTN